MDPSTLDESGLESAYDDCVGKVKLHGWWVGVMYVLIIPDESFPCNWGNDDDPCDEEELGAGCSELRSDPCFSTLSILFPPSWCPEMPSPFPHFTHALLPQFPPNLLPPYPMSHRLLKLIVRCNRPFGRESSHPHSL